MTADQVIPIACSLVSCGCAVFVSIRAANWRQSDAARDLDERIGKIESRVQATEIRQEDLPSKADVTRLTATMEALNQKTAGLEAAVFRIEDHFIRNYGGPR